MCKGYENAYAIKNFTKPDNIILFLESEGIKQT